MKRPDNATEEPLLGYFCVREHETLGAVGGLLVVTADARPVEFHCTEPVRTNRAQQILYGPTLRPHVVGDCIGGALLRQAKARLALLLATDADEAGAATRVGLPAVVVSDASLDTIVEGLPPVVADAVRRLAETVDLAEPFERIRAAIDEAQRTNAAGDADVAAAA